MIAAALVAAATLSIWLIVLYNRLVRDRALVAAAWSDVEVQLKRRHDLIPDLVETTRQHAGFEREVLEGVAARRANAAAAHGPAASAAAEAPLGRDLHRLIAVAESYPDLKASQSFLNLQISLSETEDQIQFARRYYNGAVNNLNTRVETFPDILVARAFGFRASDYFELDEGTPAS